MEVKKVIPSGFCKGVINAINLVKKTVNDYPDKQIYILGMLVHNRYVCQAFEHYNVITLNDPNKTKMELLDEIDDGVIVFTAHGIDPKIKQYAINKGLIVVDATCSDVIHNTTLINEYLSKDYDVIYIGKANHPESDAVVCLSDKIHLVSSLSDIDSLQIENDKIVVTNQTTLSILDIAILIEAIKKRYPSSLLFEEICQATKARQTALTNIKGYDCLVVVGDPNSNNTTQLAKIGASNFAYLIKVENASQLAQYDFSNINLVAVTAGASSPSYLTNQVINYLKTFDKQYLEIDTNKILDV